MVSEAHSSASTGFRERGVLARCEGRSQGTERARMVSALLGAIGVNKAGERGRLRLSADSLFFSPLKGLSISGDFLLIEGLQSAGGFGVLMTGKNDPLLPQSSDTSFFLEPNVGAEIFRCGKADIPCGVFWCVLTCILILRCRGFGEGAAT